MKAALLPLCLLAGTACAQPDFTLRPLFGHWQSDGRAFNAPAQSTMHWQPVLKDKHVRLDYRIEILPGTDQSSVFEGVAYYRDTGQDTLRAWWVDNSGDSHPITATFSDGALTAHWGVAGQKQGRTRYRLLEDGGVQVTDWVLTDAGWRQFNDNRFQRREAAGTSD